MTQKEFLRKYHNYRVLNKSLAETEAKMVNEIGIDEDEVVVRKFLDSYCLMLKSASDCLSEMDT